MCPTYKPLQKPLETNAESCLAVHELLDNSMALSRLYLLPSQDEALKKEPVFLFLQALQSLPCSFLSLSTSGKLIPWQQCHPSLPLPVEMENFLVWMGEKAVQF